MEKTFQYVTWLFRYVFILNPGDLIPQSLLPDNFPMSPHHPGEALSE